MSNYTTGELAKLCGTTVRTVQYYDTRGILVPSQLSEGGRRLYSQEDLKRMQMICFLRDLGLPLNAIAQLLSEKDPASVIDLLLEQQRKALHAELAEGQRKLEKLEQLQRELHTLEQVSLESIGDIAYLMEHKEKLRRIRGIMLGVGIPLEVIESSTFIYALVTGLWWPFLLGLGVVIVGSIWMVNYYYKNIAYICPQCHTVFKPNRWQIFWAPHTPSTRRLTCTSCGHKGFCVEVYQEDAV